MSDSEEFGLAMNNDDVQIEALFRGYRASCSDVEPGPNFMPALWQKIENRRSFSFAFARFGRTVMAFSAVLCLFLALLNFTQRDAAAPAIPFYTDALAADHTAEKTYYTEAIRPIPATDQSNAEYSHEE